MLPTRSQSVLQYRLGLRSHGFDTQHESTPADAQDAVHAPGFRCRASPVALLHRHDDTRGSSPVHGSAPGGLRWSGLPMRTGRTEWYQPQPGWRESVPLRVPPLAWNEETGLRTANI